MNHGPEITIAARFSLKSVFTSAPETSWGINLRSCSDFTQFSDFVIAGVSNCARPSGVEELAPEAEEDRRVEVEVARLVGDAELVLRRVRGLREQRAPARRWWWAR